MRSARCLALAVLVLGTSPAAAEGTLAILALDMAQETTARAAHAAEAAGLDKGWAVEVEDAAGDIAAQARTLEEEVERGIDSILLVRTRSAELQEPLAAAGRAGIPVVSVLSGADPLVALDVAINEFEMGARIGVHLLDLMGGEGGLLMERASDAQNSRVRGRVMDLILEETPAVRLVAAEEVDPASPPEAMRAQLAPWLDRHLPEARAIWTAADGQAFVTDDLLRERGVRADQVTLTTVGGGQEAFRRLRDPQSLLDATVVVPYELMGEAGVDALDDLIAGVPKEQIASGSQLLIDTVLVDRANVPPEDEWPW
jgi:simple sugar transport system substrate-binding protein/ribose transport system substrate-binding protein